jgi:hypothetical protein
MSAHDSHSHSTDAKAAFTGLIAGLIFLFIVVYGVHELTNKKFEGHKPAAEAQH